ncbi:hypothetical protein QOZ80_5BG0453370 [Eleusine coracana subsp. coracana]|nr:hypothetical protein QOZ80_5BG0453370 [Eleusine coracana subsp. coracana]
MAQGAKQMAEKVGPQWLPEGMDQETSFLVNIRIVANNTRSRWYFIDKVVDSDTTNFKDFIDEILDKYPCDYGDIVKLYYYCFDTKSSIPISTDQDLVDVFAKHVDSKVICMYLSYQNPNCEAPKLFEWHDSVQVLCTWSLVPIPSIELGTQSNYKQPTQSIDKQPIQSGDKEPTLSTEELSEDTYLLNPQPENEHIGVDEEKLYLCEPLSDSGANKGNANSLCDSDSDSDSESSKYEEEEEEEEEQQIKDNVPPHIPENVYDKNDPPMTVGSIYPNLKEFKLALASHAIKNEFEYNIEVSEPGRFRAHCIGKPDGCKWRIHASCMADNVTIKVKRNPHEHDCISTRRTGRVKPATKFWICDKVKDWLVEDPSLGAKELRRRIKEHHKGMATNRQTMLPCNSNNHIN